MIIHLRNPLLTIKYELAKTEGNARDPHWGAWRKAHIGKACVLCGSTTKLELHHIVPFHKDRSKELDVNNVITLCEANADRNCHLLGGHLGNFKGWNPDIREQAPLLAAMLIANQARIKSGSGA